MKYKYTCIERSILHVWQAEIKFTWIYLFREKKDLRSIALTRLHPMERLGPFDRFISQYKITDLINHALINYSLLGAKGGSLDPKDPP